MKQNTHWNTTSDGVRPFADNCAVVEMTGDGLSVGRCWHYVGKERKCPRHGDVTEVQQTYVDTGNLTRSDELAREEGMTDRERAMERSVTIVAAYWSILKQGQCQLLAERIRDAMLEFAANEVETCATDSTFRAEELRAQIGDKR